MKKITALLVKKLRLQTGVGIIDCKNALIETKGNLEKSVDFLRKLGHIKAIQKKSHITSKGSIFIGHNKKYSAMLELNCETDFVSKECNFISFGEKIVNHAIMSGIEDSELLRKFFENERIDLISKLNENVFIRRIIVLKGHNIGRYLHHNRIGVLVETTSNFKKELIKNISMHIASSKPEYLCANVIPSSIIDREYNIQLELAKKSKKPDFIIKKIVEGKMTKFFNEISLLGQNFIFNSEKTVGDIILENDINIIAFYRFEVGECI
ncbi:MAG: translation elongation factor Ts [Buchnera aphidicola (Nurudea yanoniella)]